MKRNAPLVCFCLFSFFLPLTPLFSQSLYQDALDLAKIMQQTQPQKVGDSLWMRLSYSMPFVISGQGFKEESFDTLHAVTETDYLLTNKGAYPRRVDTLPRFGAG